MAIEKHSLSIAGHRTSISLEAPFWAAFRDIAAEKRLSVSALVQQIDKARLKAGDDAASYNLSSAIRVYVLNEMRMQLAQRCAGET